MKSKKIKDSQFKKFIGKWSTEGRILETNENPSIKIKGTDTYELILDGFFILHKANVLMGKDISQTYEIIGIGKSEKQFTMQHYDNSGALGLMSATLKNGTWNYAGKELRFTGRFNRNGNEFSGLWQKLNKSKWVDFIEINLSKKKLS